MLWDSRQPLPWIELPHLSSHDYSAVNSIVRSFTGSRDQVVLGSSTSGHFLSAEPGEQTVVEVSQYDPRRSNAEGSWSLLAVYTAGGVKVMKAGFGGRLLKPVRVPGRAAECILLDSSGGAQGDLRDYLRLISIDGLRFAVVKDIGMARYEYCQGEPGQRTPVVADQLFWRPAAGGGVSIRREHYVGDCVISESFQPQRPSEEDFRLLGSDDKDAETVYLSLKKTR